MRRIFLFPLLAARTLSGAELPDIIDFNDHVQPILSENCYQCHGPDSSTREPKKSPLRLDREEFAFLARKSGKPTIIKGDPNASDIIKRIISTDVNNVMPPPESHKKPLKPHEVALLKKWVEQGAPYEEHWSFISPTKATPPASDWAHTPIDHFIAAKQREKNLTPSPPEDPARLLRRLTFDLTGLPPTPAEVSAFREMAAMDLPAAVEMTVGKLVTTDAYAEHFARHWLDAARYADTHGIHIDNYRTIWPYRDWVIESFRQNMPFDQFTREQIAGDLLPNSSLDQKIATGFNRCMPTTGEGGAIAKEYEAIYAADQASTTSAIWLGLSTGCAACHDHKFDPISQKDFYALTAFFRNTTMDAMDKNKADHPPNIFAPLLNDRRLWKSIDREIASADQAITKRRREAQPDFQVWLAAQDPTAPSGPVLIPEASLPLIVSEKKITATINGEEKTFNFPHKTTNAPGLGDVANISGINVPLGDLATFDARDQVTFGGFIYLDGSANGAVISRMDSSSDYRGWDLWLENSHLGSHIVDQWPDKAIKAVTTAPLERRKWHHVMITYDGSATPDQSLTIYVNGKAAPLKYSYIGKVDSLLTKVPTRLGARHPDIEVTGTASFHGFQFFKRKLTPSEIEQSSQKSDHSQLLAVPADERTDDQNKALLDHYIQNIDAPTKELLARKNTLVEQKNSLRANGSPTLVMEEKKEDAFAHILDRGEYALEKEKVFADIPEVFQNKKSGSKKSRLDLADWLVSDNNPLTARVTVNRLWYYFFGRGIVETTEDFGIMGARATHPDLLDYLAIELVESNWNLQHVVKLITSSATYQQSEKTTSANREKDPTNILLWRSPRHRLEAEQLRDLALASSGLLVEKVGGPPVKPYQPGNIWDAVAMKESNTRFYKQDAGDALYRRSIYTFWKRTAAPPSMEILNAPTREVFCVRRDRTNTPLAAFVTMNDPQFVEAARALATTALKANQSFSHRLDHITMALMARTLDNKEQEVVKTALDHHLKHYQENPDLIDPFLTVGESKPDTSLNKAALAAWTLISSQIFNLDETLTK
ncbi:MAG: hypothetical protein ACJAQT_000769 [Akkermansiaceae bacterium]|jgi:hypothetical protein